MVATLVMAVAVFAAMRMLPDEDRWSIYTLRLAVGVCAGAAVYFAVAALVGMQELRDVLRRAPRAG
jgi:hypothetical protein